MVDLTHSFVLVRVFIFVFCFVHFENVIALNGTEGSQDPFPIPTSGRLPTWIVPSHYNLRLSVYLENATYDGSITIDFEVVNATDKIVLNALDLVMFNETCKVIWKETGNELFIKNQSYNLGLQFYVIHLKEALIKGQKYQVGFSFRGTLNNKLVGFYLSSYENADGTQVRVASTQFSPTDARRAFPCFDEPLFKATFKISIERDGSVKSLSNMPLNSSLPVNGKENRFVDDFPTTLKMSTYLVGFLVSDFSYKSSDFLNRTQFKIWCREDALNQVDYALEIGPRILRFLEGYFGTDFPLPKLDMAAIPNFKFNGMENWGLIMYRESAVLYDPLVSTVKNKRNVIAVIGHEIAHMWFGNLVTPKWWSELWLKEGFANFMGYTAIENVEPEWKMMDYIVRETMYDALEADSLLSSHPINVEVDHPDRISEIFDNISYKKGASIIRMMFHFLSEDVYKRGMQNYIKTLQYGNAVQEDLWKFLTEAWKETDLYDPSRTVETIMNTWTLQEGYPVVNATRNDTQILLSQERFLFTSIINNNSGTEDVANQQWWIPISLVQESEPHFNQTQPKVFMQPLQDITILPGILEKSKWYIINVQKTGFYRVNYDTENWLQIKNQLMDDFSLIHYLNRGQIVDDAFNLARSGYLDYDIVLEMSNYMKRETDFTVWSTFVNNFEYIFKMARSVLNDLTPFNKFIEDLLIPLFNMTGFEDSASDSYDIQELRILMTKTACFVGHKPCIEAASKLFSQWLEHPLNESSGIIANNIKPTVLCTGIKEASPQVWNQTFQVYLNSNSQTEKGEILLALGCTNDSSILTRFLDMALNSSSGIIKQDIATVFKGVSQTKTGQKVAWKIIQGHWNFLIEYLGSGSPLLWHILEEPTSYFNSEEDINELKEFERTYGNKLGSARQTLQQKLEGAEINKIWTKLYLQKIQNLLQNRNANFTI